MRDSSRGRIGRWVLGLGAALALGYLTLLVLAWVFTNRMLFPAPEVSYRDDYTVIKLDVPGSGEISSVLLANPNARYTILYSHGNAEDLGYMMGRLRRLAAFGFNVFAYDYPGYGTSEGRPTEDSVNAAAETAYAYLTQDLGIPPEKIILYGRSLGSGPSVKLAAEEPVGGLILESAFYSAHKVISTIPFLPWDRFENGELLPEVACPVLVIHGTDDTVVPPWHARALLDAVSQPAMFLFVDAGHNDVVQKAGEIYWNTLRSFMNSVQEGSRPEPVL